MTVVVAILGTEKDVVAHSHWQSHQSSSAVLFLLQVLPFQSHSVTPTNPPFSFT
jgi:hypothetical protein